MLCFHLSLHNMSVISATPQKIEIKNFLFWATVNRFNFTRQKAFKNFFWYTEIAHSLHPKDFGF